MLLCFACAFLFFVCLDEGLLRVGLVPLCWVNFLPHTPCSRRTPAVVVLPHFPGFRKSFGSSEGNGSCQCFVGLRFYFHILRHKTTTRSITSSFGLVYCLDSRKAYFHHLRPERKKRKTVRNWVVLVCCNREEKSSFAESNIFVPIFAHAHLLRVLSLALRCVPSLHCCQWLLVFSFILSSLRLLIACYLLQKRNEWVVARCMNIITWSTTASICDYSLFDSQRVEMSTSIHSYIRNMLLASREKALLLLSWSLDWSSKEDITREVCDV